MTYARGGSDDDGLDRELTRAEKVAAAERANMYRGTPTMPPTYSSGAAREFATWLMQAGPLLDMAEHRERFKAALPSLGAMLADAATLAASWDEESIYGRTVDSFQREVANAARDCGFRVGIDPDVVTRPEAISEWEAGLEAADPEDDE